MAKKLSKYQQILKDAVHYKAIGQRKFFLHDVDNDRPWDLVVSFEPTSHNPTSIYFTAKDSKNKFEFTWDVSLRQETDSVELPVHVLDPKLVKKILNLLPPKQIPAFVNYLKEQRDVYGKEAGEMLRAHDELMFASDAIDEVLTELI
jgi:hypothetical protein